MLLVEGYFAHRGTMGPKEWSIGVFGIIRDAQGKILITKRSDGQGWDLPGGGIDKQKDFSFADTLCREIKEETGLTVEGIPILIGVYPCFEVFDLMVLYFVPKTKGTPRTSVEAEEFRFVNFTTLCREIKLVWQAYPGHTQGRFFEMARDGFSFLSRLTQKRVS